MMSLGRLIYLTYYAPLGAIRRSWREGGPLAQAYTDFGRRAMAYAAEELPSAPPIPQAERATSPHGGDALTCEVHLLTGRRFWFQSAFCAGSLAAYAASAGVRVQPVFYDDGTLTIAWRERLAQALPEARFVLIEETRARLDTELPTNQFPTLRERWEHYPNLRKLTDPHIGSTGWKLVLDSDLLFFRCPDFLLDWLRTADRPCHMVDIADAYGYERALLEELAEASLPQRLNVGICGLDSSALDWERLEYWTARLHARVGTSYYLEQALVAMLTAGQDCAVAPASDYITWPTDAEARMPIAVMHHYVAESKIPCFRHAWRVCLDRWIAASGTTEAGISSIFAP